MVPSTSGSFAIPLELWDCSGRSGHAEGVKVKLTIFWSWGMELLRDLELEIEIELESSWVWSSLFSFVIFLLSLSQI